MVLVLGREKDRAEGEIVRQGDIMLKLTVPTFYAVCCPSETGKQWICKPRIERGVDLFLGWWNERAVLRKKIEAERVRDYYKKNYAGDKKVDIRMFRRNPEKLSITDNVMDEDDDLIEKQFNLHINEERKATAAILYVRKDMKEAYEGAAKWGIMDYREEREKNRSAVCVGIVAKKGFFSRKPKLFEEISSYGKAERIAVNYYFDGRFSRKYRL